MHEEQDKTKEQTLIELVDRYYKEKNYDKACEISEQLIEMGSTYGYYVLGTMFFLGEGVQKNLYKAVEYLKKSGAYGYYEIGIMYYNGIEVKQDYAKAREYFEKAGERGYSFLGKMYLFGVGVEQDYSKAREYFEKARNNNVKHAYLYLGYIYENGYGVNKDNEMAKNFYEKYIAVVGNENSYADIGRLYQDDKKYDEALKWYKKACELGSTEVYRNLGEMYEHGLGVEKSFDKAAECYEKVGDIYSLRNLSFMYNEIGPTRDYKKSIKYLEMAAQAGDERAKYCLGYIEDVNYVNLFCSINGNDLDDHTRMIRKEIANGAKVYCYKNINEILENIDSIPDDAIINLYIYEKCYSKDFIHHFYTVSDMKKIIKVCKNLLADIDLNQSEEDIFMQIYIKLGHIMTYSIQDETAHTLLSLITKKGCCEGIALSLKVLLNMVGIEANYISTLILDAEDGHAYNQVKINGKWYNCDLTNDRSIMKFIFLFYCLKSKNSCFFDDYYVQNESDEHEANENYPHVQKLFRKNLFRIYKNNISALFRKKKKLESSSTLIR